MSDPESPLNTVAAKFVILPDFAEELAVLLDRSGPELEASQTPGPDPGKDAKDQKDNKDQSDTQKNNKDTKEQSDKSAQDKSTQDMVRSAVLPDQLSTEPLANLIVRHPHLRRAMSSPFRSLIHSSLRPNLAVAALRDEPDLSAEDIRQLTVDFERIVRETSEALARNVKSTGSGERAVD